MNHPGPSGRLEQVGFLSPESKLHTEKQRSASMLHTYGAGSQRTAGLLQLVVLE